jgi:hypothetical protein
VKSSIAEQSGFISFCSVSSARRQVVRHERADLLEQRDLLGRDARLDLRVDAVGADELALDTGSFQIAGCPARASSRGVHGRATWSASSAERTERESLSVLHG